MRLWQAHLTHSKIRQTIPKRMQKCNICSQGCACTWNEEEILNVTHRKSTNEKKKKQQQQFEANTTNKTIYQYNMIFNADQCNLHPLNLLWMHNVSGKRQATADWMKRREMNEPTQTSRFSRDFVPHESDRCWFHNISPLPLAPWLVLDYSARQPNHSRRLSLIELFVTTKSTTIILPYCPSTTTTWTQN